MKRAFGVLLVVRSLSSLLTGIDVVVLAWLVLDVSDRPFDLAVMAALGAGASMVATFFGGPLIDRFSRRAVTAATEFGRTLPLAVLPLLAAADLLRPWHVLVAGAWVSGLYAVSSASYGALLPELFDRQSLLRANGTWQFVSQAGVFVGAAAGGGMITWLGPANPLLLGVAGRVVTGCCLVLMRWRSVPRPPVGRTGGLLFRDMAAAMGFLRRHRALLWAVIFSGVPGSLINGINAVLPAFVREDNGMGAAEYGLVDAAWGVGALLAGLVLAGMSVRYEEHRYHSGSVLLVGLSIIALGTTTTLPWSLAAAAVAGGLALGSLVLFRAYLQAETPDEYTGRVLATSQLVVSALWLVVSAGVGVLTLVVTVRTVIFCWGAVIVLSALACQVVLRRADRQLPQSACGEA